MSSFDHNREVTEPIVDLLYRSAANHAVQPPHDSQSKSGCRIFDRGRLAIGFYRLNAVVACSLAGVHLAGTNNLMVGSLQVEMVLAVGSDLLLIT